LAYRQISPRVRVATWIPGFGLRALMLAAMGERIEHRHIQRRKMPDIARQDG
jgi:hypothetical protein